MRKKNAKIEKILDISIELLRQEGDFGVSMRKVASLSEMSLSNVQYYFKTKDELLKAMADRYFQQCLIDLSEQGEIQTRDELKSFVTMLLAHGHEISDMCRIFREYWAISTRNTVIDDYLMSYYRSMAESIANILTPLAEHEEGRKKGVAVLVSFVEGYSITARAMPVLREDMTQMVTDIVLNELTK